MTAAIANAWNEGDQETVDLLLVGKQAMVRFFAQRDGGGGHVLR